jgi:hypothetical protein
MGEMLLTSEVARSYATPTCGGNDPSELRVLHAWNRRTETDRNIAAVRLSGSCSPDEARGHRQDRRHRGTQR